MHDSLMGGRWPKTVLTKVRSWMDLASFPDMPSSLKAAKRANLCCSIKDNNVFAEGRLLADLTGLGRALLI